MEFQTTDYSINEIHDINILLENLNDNLTNKISIFERKHSGWNLKHIVSLDLNVNKHIPQHRTSFVNLPYDIRSKKAVINVKNKDLQSLKWALLSWLYPVSKDSDRVTTYSKYENKLNFTGVQFPVKLTDIGKVEELNNLSINVFGLEYNTEKKCNTVIGPLYYSKSRKSTRVNLLYTINNGNNAHYCFIKNLSRIVSKQISNRDHAIHICDGCLLYFNTKQALIDHNLYDCAHIRTDLPSHHCVRLSIRYGGRGLKSRTRKI